MLRYWTAGESHGKAMLALVDGFPAGVPIETGADRPGVAAASGRIWPRGSAANRNRHRRHSDRDLEEHDAGQPDRSAGRQPGLQAGADGRSPATAARARRPDRSDQVPRFHSWDSGACECPRDGDARRGRAPWRRNCSSQFGITALGYVVELGGVAVEPQPGSIDDHRKLRDASIVYSLNPDQDPQFKQLIDETGKAGDTLGGIVEVRVEGLPFGLGTHAQWDWKLDGRIAQAVMAVQAIKGVEIGLGFEAARRPGSQVHDPIHYDDSDRDTPALGFRPADKSCRWTGGRDDERTAAGRSCSEEADQHVAQAAGVDQPGNERKPGSTVRTKRCLCRRQRRA